MNLSEIKEKLNFKEKFENLNRRSRKNGLVAHFYETLSGDLEFDDLPDAVYESPFFDELKWKICSGRGRLFEKKALQVASCANYVSGDYYIFQGVKDIKKINLCRDRFCDNCQNTLSVQRFEKYEPLLLRLSEDYDIDHVILTVPNVPLAALSKTLDNMLKAYKKLNIYLSGRKLARNVDFLSYGYLGSIRALEITKNKDNNTYHPHFHCMFIRRKGIKMPRRHINSYSFSRSEHRKANINNPTYFSDFEILLQKAWYLLLNKIEINYSNIDDLKIGYDCMVKPAKGRYKEVFKYATKGLLSSNSEKDAVSCYNDFVVLFFALYHRRLIQGYGILYRLNFSDDIDIESVDDMYLEVVKELHNIENPEFFMESRESVVDEINKPNITYISRRSLSRVGAKDYEA